MSILIQLVLAFVLGGIVLGTAIADERDVALRRSLEAASLTWLILAVFTGSSAASGFGPWSDLLWNAACGVAFYLLWRIVVAYDKKRRRT